MAKWESACLIGKSRRFESGCLVNLVARILTRANADVDYMERALG